MRKPVFAALTVGACFAAALDAQPRRQPPYWASIDSGRAMMRTGPGRNYPGTWLYVRRDLPVRVLTVYREWRRIRDPDGTTGWMLVTLLSDRRTAIVRGNGVRPLHIEPDERSPVSWRVEPGVVGRLSRCANGWCRLDTGERGGFIRSDHLWGLGRNEVIG
ncbi:MAG: SH3 domain-containing protein [Sphingosinicella sp.]